MGLQSAIKTTSTFGGKGLKGTSKPWKAYSKHTAPWRNYTRMIGNDVYISLKILDHVWFQWHGTGSGTGDNEFRVYGMSKGATEDFFNNRSIPYNKIYWGGTNALFVKVPGGTLWPYHWPWHKALGYC